MRRSSLEIEIHVTSHKRRLRSSSYAALSLSIVAALGARIVLYNTGIRLFLKQVKKNY